MTLSHKRIEKVTTVPELQAAIIDKTISHIELLNDLYDVPSFRLGEGQSLYGPAIIHFIKGNDGVQLSSNNRLENLTLISDVEKRAILNDPMVDGLGRLELQSLTLTGVVQLLIKDKITSGHIEAHDIDIIAADARSYDEHPKGYGVEVIQGAFTLWNQQADPSIAITADLTNLSVGQAGKPVRGSGIFVSGAGDVGGRLLVKNLKTGAVFSDGGIAKGTANRITGGVFTVYGCFVDEVINSGPVTTYGPNDMVLDNWGTVDSWQAWDKITSYGPSGIGFVNFGIVNQLKISGIIETFGQGARGFNVYTGTVHEATFERVVTHGDGSVGIQISQPVGEISVYRGIETFGGTGDSLVKGVVVTLSAIALSIKPGGSVREISIEGGITTHGEGVSALELQGSVNSLTIEGGVNALGGGFDKI